MTQLIVNGVITPSGGQPSQFTMLGLPNVTDAVAQAKGYASEWDPNYQLPSGASGIYFGHENNASVTGNMPGSAQIWHNLDRVFINTTRAAGNNGDVVNRAMQIVRNSGFGYSGQVLWATLSDAVDSTGNKSSVSGGLLGHEIDVECNDDDDGVAPAVRQGLSVVLIKKQTGVGTVDPKAQTAVGVWQAGNVGNGGWYNCYQVGANFYKAAINLLGAVNKGGASAHHIWLPTNGDIALDNNAATKISSDGSTVTLSGGLLSIPDTVTQSYSSGIEYNSAGTFTISSATNFGMSIDIGANGIHAGALIASSDRRLKANVKSISMKAGEAFVNSVTPSTYTIKGRKDAGFIAQDIIKSGHGHLVVGKKDEKMKKIKHKEGYTSPAGVSFGVNYNATIPYLTAALKSALKKIAKLEQQMEKLNHA